MGDRPPLPRAAAAPLAWVYARIIAARNRRFDARKGVIEFDRPTISVGNLSVGGTGKTPMVMHVIRILLDAGHRPCIAMRGYGAGAGGSDEAAEYAHAFPDVPVVAQPDRTGGLIRLFGSAAGERVDCIVLDDGFQHRRIARDLDVVLVDATRDPFEDAHLPLGWLREPVGSLARASAIVITHAESVAPHALDALEKRLRERAPSVPISRCEHEWQALRVFEAGAEREEPIEFLRGRTVVGACAIGNPAPFLSAVRTGAGRELGAGVVLRDHDPFGPGTVRKLFSTARDSRAAAIVITEKDWSKLRRVPAADWPCPVVRPVLTLRFQRGGPELDALVLERVRARPHVPVEELLGPEPDAAPGP